MCLFGAEDSVSLQNPTRSITSPRNYRCLPLSLSLYYSSDAIVVIAKAVFCSLRRASRLCNTILHLSSSLRPIFLHEVAIFCPLKLIVPPNPRTLTWILRHLSNGTVNMVISEGKPKFETHQAGPPKNEKWKTKKMFKLQKKREKEKRKSANKRDPRHFGLARKKKKKKKKKFANAEERIKYKLEKFKAKIKEALLLE
ncbi:uncharacterized protein LOC111307750 [Durio zibethinus]|uniref:Uncharacterized protein LOC111307750 n=1 Tax=Durio zibethinus TaxID=66656 RepID=A0A6P6A9W5_DURZI|nr:uncharacterized protein LOC111307750 [Durio zibethinus]